ncbi:13827_t:CDS:2 [Cetraspora pellucida]|uniref:13827_t:CDS:1 n=1 Tax=Cetraspora pellucida TaxID=1433469 RepID=A0A9N9NNJ7_9GLOM|nr:13827_t:CDS:2 [Cetraspora pellucida]
MQKTKHKNAAKNYILTQSRDSSGRFSKPAGTESSDSEYSDLEYSDPELLVYESENNNEEYFNNEEMKLDDEEAEHSKLKKLEVKYEMSDSDISDSDIENNSSISEQINKLKNKLKDVKNMNAYEYLCFLAVHKYLTAIFNHEELHSRIKLSLEISQQVFQYGPWMARCIQTLSVSKQEQQKYISTLIDNKNVQNSCLRFIHTTGERLTVDKFQNYIQNNILPNQDIYYNGHECPDVVQYRAVFLEKMKDLEALMPQFVDDNMETVINPEINKEKQVYILVTHDECTFYANDSYPSVWAPLGMLPLHKKGKGKALMVSEFLTETRGCLTITPAEINELNLSSTFPQEARVIVKPGKNDDGWWNASDMLMQVSNKAILIFEATHPNCIGIFAFDSSTNHSALASDALCAKNMNLFPVTQPMIFPNDLPLDDDNYIFCNQPKDIQQPDFTMQKSALEELIVERGHICIFYPKFYCELNFIEQYWGAAKRYAHEHCDYSWARLQVTVPEIFDSVLLTTIRHFA